MAEFVMPIATPIAEYSVAPIARQISYLFDYTSNVEELKNEIEKLGDVKGRVERDIDAAWRNGDEIEADVEKWLESVNEITEEARKFLDDEDKAKNRCFYGFCLKSRCQLSKKAKKTAVEVVKIQNDGKFNRVSYRVPLQWIESTSIKGYEAFGSRMSVFKGIMEAVRNPSINMIGVFGMGGVGKTMLVKEVAREAKEDKLFDVVVMTNVSRTPNIGKIQGEIADMIGLTFDQESELGRASRLCARLKKENRILIILDDIWAKLDLEAVGIPFGDDDERCKTVVTSRSQDVLLNEMNAQETFEIGELLEQEAWNLFKKMAGDSVEAPDLKPTAIKVAKECAGLPIAVAAVANALKNKSLPVWEDALKQLRLSTPTNINGMDAKVYSPLKLSYESLESEEAKSLFLLCSLLPEGSLFSIGGLLKYGKGLGLFQGINTLEEARNRVHTLVHHLKASCLLLDSYPTGLFRMHDVVRDVGISVASKDKHMLIAGNGVDLEEWKTEEILRICPAISLLYTDIQELPTGLECPELKLFLLVSKYPSLKIPGTFFEGMKQLTVLELRNVCFSSLPSSLHLLTNLQTLCLDQCILSDIGIIGELKKLEILSFLNSDIEELPRAIGQLTCLRLLDLSDCSKLKVIPSNLLASLSKLEDLCMKNSFVQWEVEGNASLAELKQLSHLISLDIQIPDAKILPKGLLFEKLKRYRIFVGDVWDWSGVYETSRTLKLKLDTSIHLQSRINTLLKRTEDLYLDELNGLKNVLYDLDREGFPHLKHLEIQRSCEIEYVIDTVEWSAPHSAFPNLESLFLNNMVGLKGICHGQLPVESFHKLTTLKVECCDRLKNLCSSSMARGLQQLTGLEIIECKIMDEIVATVTEGEDDDNNKAMDKIVFPQLRFLKLQNLLELVTFRSKLSSLPCVLSRIRDLLTTKAESEEIIAQGELGTPVPLFNEKVAFPSLDHLILSELPKLKQIWHGQLPVESPNLQLLVVENCASLLNVVPSKVLQNLKNLRIITVESCDSVEQVFDLEGLNCDEEHSGLLSHLIALQLIMLPTLRCIWNKDPQGILSFQNLKWLKIEDCNSLRNMFSYSMALDLVQLQVLKIKNCHRMEEILEKEKGAKEEAIDKIVFPQLSLISVERLPNLRSFYSGNHNFECPSLKRIMIVGCPKVKTFTSTYEGFQRTSGIPSAPLFNEKAAFPNLEALIILGDPLIDWKCLSIFKTSVAKSLVQLQELKIGFCHMVEEFVEKEGIEEAMNKILFPQVTSLDLYHLLQFKSFCQGIYISEWPSLKNLEVHYCARVEIFASELSSFKEMCGNSHLGTPTKQPIFLTNKFAFPNLEELELNGLFNMKEIWRGQFHAQSFCKLRVLKVIECCRILKVFPANLLLNLQNLEELSVQSCPLLEEVFELGGVAGEFTLPNLEKLELTGLFSMKEIWKGHFHAQSFCKLRVLKVIACDEILKVFPISLLRNLQNLEELYVDSCASLEEVFELEGVDGEVGHAAILPQLRELRLIKLHKLMHLWKKDSLSPVFQNLMTLQVRSCGSLTHLLPSAIAKSLVQIKSVSVGNCKMMKEIITSEKGEVTDETTFHKLNSLELYNLPNIISFCPGSNIFSFPSLEKVMVGKCLKLKTFSNGISRTPKLEKVTVQWNKWRWEGDLNTTIKRLFIQKKECSGS